MLNDMMSRKFDSYGYDRPESFVTIGEQKGFEYPEPIYVEPELSEIKSFFTEKWEDTVDLVEPIIDFKKNNNQ